MKVSKRELKDSPMVSVELDGYKTASIVLKRQVKGSAVIGNIIFLFIGLPVDFLTGAIYKSSPERINYNLEKKD